MSLAPASVTRTSDTLIFAPTYNERRAIGPFLDSVFGLPERCDVLIIDDNSSDGTTEVLAARATTEPRLQLVIRPGKLGIGSAHKWSHARQHGYSRFVTLDADLHDPHVTRSCCARRRRGRRVRIEIPAPNLITAAGACFLSRNANRGARRLLRLPLTEYTNSLRAARLDRIPSGLIEGIRNDGYAFFLNYATQFVRHSLTVREIPIRFRDRQGGVSKFSKGEIVWAMVALIRLTLKSPRYSNQVNEGPR